jgi:hypothetical protein
VPDISCVPDCTTTITGNECGVDLGTRRTSRGRLVAALIATLACTPAPVGITDIPLVCSEVAPPLPLPTVALAIHRKNRGNFTLCKADQASFKDFSRHSLIRHALCNSCRPHAKAGIGKFSADKTSIRIATNHEVRPIHGAVFPPRSAIRQESSISQMPQRSAADATAPCIFFCRLTRSPPQH